MHPGCKAFNSATVIIAAAIAIIGAIALSRSCGESLMGRAFLIAGGSVAVVGAFILCAGCRNTRGTTVYSDAPAPLPSFLGTTNVMTSPPYSGPYSPQSALAVHGHPGTAEYVPPPPYMPQYPPVAGFDGWSSASSMPYQPPPSYGHSDMPHQPPVGGFDGGNFVSGMPHLPPTTYS